MNGCRQVSVQKQGLKYNSKQHCTLTADLQELFLQSDPSSFQNAKFPMI